MERDFNLAEYVRAADRATPDHLAMAIIRPLGVERRLYARLIATARLVRYKLPRVWLAVPVLPRTLTGKINRRVLRQTAPAVLPKDPI